MMVTGWKWASSAHPYAGCKVHGPAHVYLDGGGLLHVLVVELDRRRVGVYWNRELAEFRHIELVEQWRSDA